MYSISCVFLQSYIYLIFSPYSIFLSTRVSKGGEGVINLIVLLYFGFLHESWSVTNRQCYKDTYGSEGLYHQMSHDVRVHGLALGWEEPRGLRVWGGQWFMVPCALGQEEPYGLTPSRAGASRHKRLQRLTMLCALWHERS